MKIKDLPPPIKRLARRNVEKQWGLPNPITCGKTNLSSAFIWDKSIEGHEYWFQVNNGNFDFEPRKEVMV